MKLILPKKILKDYFEYLYYSILPEYTLWDKKVSIIVEPICSLKIDRMKIVDWKIIDEILNTSLQKSKIRNYIKDELDLSDLSDLEQVLFPLSKNVFELDDNPFLYPGERLKKLVYEILPYNPAISLDIDGICHFHPTNEAYFSDLDNQSLRKFANIMEKYNKKYILALIIARGDMYNYIQKAKESKSQFVGYMMNSVENIKFNAKIFYSKKGKEKHVDILLE
ncbi:MAG: hypothetical protein DRJ45_06040 [Thermoprotei archaeon]|nr:MAG: hypothetical protein DRJ45_06040 [Thermoprotei archaeon]